MRRIFLGIYSLLLAFGIDPRKTIHSLRGIPQYLRNLQTLRKQKTSTVKMFSFGIPHPCLHDRFSNGGSDRGHYFHQDLLVARRVYFNNPNIHVDVASRVDGFVAHVASFRPIVVIDIRQVTNDIPNLTSIRRDFMAPLSDDLVDYCDSVSCLHALEHFGLGRYGDSVNYDGHLLGLNNLYRLLKEGGRLYFSVPIGPQRIEFDAHRVFCISYLLECFDRKYNVNHFSFVDDEGHLHEDTPLIESNVKNNFGCVYGCGIFELTKL